jgi:trehalose 6-phosphate phosphatase
MLTLAADMALFLDVDGTLLDIAPTPDAVTVPVGLGPLLGRLEARLGGAMALVSGREIAVLDELFAPLLLPAAGQHGAELRRHGPTPCVVPKRDPLIDVFSRRLHAIAAERPGLLVEDKGLSVAIHFREAPEYADELLRLVEDMLAEEDGGIELLPARMALELKPRAATKGTAVEWFMREAPFRGRVPTFIGDDVTDESGFEAALALGGHAVRIGLAGESIAPVRLATPGELRDFLAAAANGEVSPS